MGAVAGAYLSGEVYVSLGALGVCGVCGLGLSEQGAYAFLWDPGFGGHLCWPFFRVLFGGVKFIRVWRGTCWWSGVGQPG